MPRSQNADEQTESDVHGDPSALRGALAFGPEQDAASAPLEARARRTKQDV